MEEKTLIFIKPDGVQRMLVGRIIQKFEDKGLVLQGLKLMQLTQEKARTHYAVHEGKPFFEGLIEYVTSGPIVAMVYSGVRAIAVCRSLMGATFGWKADPGTIRGDFGISGSYNLVHGSDSPESAATEIPIYFEPGELVEWAPAARPWIYDLKDDLKD
ncbi:MAG: nucleoside-diphosphate kinase [Planctomycetota bacterium]|jgi:nucleoside-diphosphate kinase